MIARAAARAHRIGTHAAAQHPNPHPHHPHHLLLAPLQQVTATRRQATSNRDVVEGTHLIHTCMVTPRPRSSPPRFPPRQRSVSLPLAAMCPHRQYTSAHASSTPLLLMHASMSARTYLRNPHINQRTPPPQPFPHSEVHSGCCWRWPFGSLRCGNLRPGVCGGVWWEVFVL